MQLNQLFCGADEVAITSITDDVNEVKSGTLFIARTGSKNRGTDFVCEAIKRGAVAIVSDSPVDVDVPVFIADDIVGEMARIADAFYGRQGDRLKVIAVIGTNGKTTVSRLLYNALNSMGKKAGVIGTLGAEWAEKKVDTGLTTPGRIKLAQLLAEMESDGIEFVAIEVSAHAIDQMRLQGICVDMGIFTNLTQDHLDYFCDMRTYARTKASFFRSEFMRCAVVNADDDLGRQISSACDIPVITYGMDTPSDVFAMDVVEEDGLDFWVNALDEVEHCNISLHGRFNVYNILAVISALRTLGFSTISACRAAELLQPVPGRFEVISTEKGRVVIDYAHTPDALGNVLSAIRHEYTGRVICVFGCGGDRDKSKRSLMGSVAEKYADVIILTTDNPRTENPIEIIKDVAQGIKGEKEVIISRKEAILYALDIMRKDTVLIAGKGAEDYIEVGKHRVPFSDKSVVMQWIEEQNFDD